MTFRAPLCTLLLTLLVMLPLSSRAGDEDRDAPAAAAIRFTNLLDTGAAADAWHALSPLATVIKSEKHWQQLQESLRAAYGPVEKRTLRGVALQNRYTMLPDGHYAIVQFDTVFRNKRATVETIVLALNTDGHWLVHDYIIN